MSDINEEYLIGSILLLAITSSNKFRYTAEPAYALLSPKSFLL